MEKKKIMVYVSVRWFHSASAENQSAETSHSVPCA